MTLSMGNASDILPLFFALLAIAAVLYLCYLFSRFLAKKANSVASTANIRILERVALAPDKGLALARICNRCYLIGFSSDRVELLKEIDETELRSSQPGTGQNFVDALNTVLKGRLDLTGHGNEKNHKINRKSK
ncbi:MAG: flagellar biosynthetic protein FliO [Oscillospiraceae bacterium]|jgi:flagellar biogenesis protein FliO|nr:flagellar biosynthetic protein FliO [Oscillospiraceae bacterium]